ncbi:hypothetical protein [Kitasatospora sp. NBC_01302]|uniref:hypothetical protein n=1 Tax=Kitasatospora sp. NBC_01302 TaxID=2903575 RepID=UPI002E11FF00|nr:hypothetical protein OG294_40255 [Kitasatospora sp. NBC_01302]
MEQSETVVTTVTIGQRGRLILPAQVQRATGITQGARVAVRTAPDGTITIEPLWAVRARLRATYSPLLTDHLPLYPARLHAGGLGVDADPGDLGPVLHPLPERDPGSGRRVYRDDQRVVVTARAVLAWLTAGPGSLVEYALPNAVLPEAGVGELITVLARAGAHQDADALLAELAVIGLRLPSPAKYRTTLAEDTAIALELTQDAVRAGYTITLPDALCAATALRLEAPLVAADLLTPAS